MSLRLNKLQVTNFRNLTPKVLSFNNNINCIFGNNGNGKTNILEAIYFLFYRKSFRKNTSFPQLISIECEQPEIIFSSIYTKDNEQHSYSGKYLLEQSQWYLDNNPQKSKLKENIVFINPFDSYAFHNTPSFRRDWMDSHFSKISKPYKSSLSKYNQSLRFRNTLLSKKPSQFIEQVKIIDLQLKQYIQELTIMRLDLINELNEHISKTFNEIFDQNHHLELKLESKFNGMGQEQIKSLLNENLEKDTIIGRTSCGSHRDDLSFIFDGFNSFDFCSLGQQKMSFLSLIFAYIELFRYKFTSYPIVLIDDVSGELDESRWRNLINYLRQKDFQVFITTANKNFQKELESIEGAKKIYISNGDIEEI